MYALMELEADRWQAPSVWERIAESRRQFTFPLVSMAETIGGGLCGQCGCRAAASGGMCYSCAEEGRGEDAQTDGGN